MLLCGAAQEVATVPRSGCTAKPPREEPEIYIPRPPPDQLNQNHLEVTACTVRWFPCLVYNRVESRANPSQLLSLKSKSAVIIKISDERSLQDVGFINEKKFKILSDPAIIKLPASPSTV